MKYDIFPHKSTNKKCLVFVGGLGDVKENYQNLILKLSQSLPNHSFCTFTLSQTSKTNDDVLIIQTHELEAICDSLIQKDKFTTLDIYATSMGAFAAVKLATNSQFSQYIDNVIFFDPANYYLEGNEKKSNESITWSGSEEYHPAHSTVSELLINVSSEKMKVNVIHLTVKNHGPKGYWTNDYAQRGTDHVNGNARLSTDMVKSFYKNTPEKNRGEYLEIPNLPHGIFRDGDVPTNTETVAQTIIDILK